MSEGLDEVAPASQQSRREHIDPVSAVLEASVAMPQAEDEWLGTAVEVVGEKLGDAAEAVLDFFSQGS